jgi:hypothetical protein
MFLAGCSDGDDLYTSGMARHHAYSAEKSAVETAGSGLKQAGSSTPPLTMLTHMAVGETREVGGEKKSWTAGTQPARLAHLLPQRRGRRSGVGRGRLTAGLLICCVCCAPHPRLEGGGETGSRAGVRGGENLTRRMLTAY